MVGVFDLGCYLNFFLFSTPYLWVRFVSKKSQFVQTESLIYNYSNSETCSRYQHFKDGLSWNTKSRTVQYLFLFIAEKKDFHRFGWLGILEVTLNLVTKRREIKTVSQVTPCDVFCNKAEWFYYLGFFFLVSSMLLNYPPYPKVGLQFFCFFLDVGERHNCTFMLYFSE